MDTRAAAAADTPLVSVRHCRQAYHKDSNADLVVLDDVDLTLRAGEIVGLLGRSGSGKSTLLRIVSGLLRPTAGEVLWRGKPMTGPAEGVAMVFQSFALFPWLTVQENVELGLEAQGIKRAERAQRAEEAIDLIGLGGYENAYPKELSGGMRQRVGLARALVVHPDLLLMDEPFSALDVLTAENLRTDLIELWTENRLPVRSILIVTHNIEEAVLMCDRILVFSSNPGRVASELLVPFSHPRNRHDAQFRKFVDDIYALMTRRATSVPAPGAPLTPAAPPIARALHPVPANLMAGPDGDAGRRTLPGPGGPAAVVGKLPAGARRAAAALRDHADAGFRRARGGRRPADRAGDTLRRRRHRGAQAPLRRGAARARAADRHDPAGPRRALEPSGRAAIVSATNSRTTCRPTMRARRWRPRSAGPVTPSCFDYDDEADQFLIEEED